MTAKARPSWVHFSRAKVCGEGAPCTRTSPQLAETSYSVGPPYIAHIEDWREIADQWWEWMPRVHAQYPHLLAEMYAFSMAAANLTLPIAQLHHLMVSDVGAGGEGWPWVERLAETGRARALCRLGPHTPPASTRDPRAALPSVLHHCQRYSIAKSNFAKRQVPHDFFSCGARALPFSHADIVAQLESSAAPSRQLKRHAFMVCNLVPRINAAQRDYQRALWRERQCDPTRGAHPRGGGLLSSRIGVVTDGPLWAGEIAGPSLELHGKSPIDRIPYMRGLNKGDDLPPEPAIQRALGRGIHCRELTANARQIGRRRWFSRFAGLGSVLLGERAQHRRPSRPRALNSYVRVSGGVQEAHNALGASRCFSCGVRREWFEAQVIVQRRVQRQRAVEVDRFREEIEQLARRDEVSARAPGRQAA